MIAPIDVTSLRIETPRLLLRPWAMADLEDFYEYARVEGVGQMAGWCPHKSREESAAILESFVREKKTFALVLKETGKAIGSLGLEERESIPEEDRGLFGREIGYVLSKDYWGRGLMPEAVGAVTDFCFHTLGYDWLTCSHFLWNNQSRRVIEKCGFRFFREGRFETRFNTVEITADYIIYNPNKRGNQCLR